MRKSKPELLFAGKNVRYPGKETEDGSILGEKSSAFFEVDHILTLWFQNSFDILNFLKPANDV